MFKIIAGVLFVIALLVGFLTWFRYCPPFSQATLQKLRPGMTEAQVCAILGPAAQTNRLGTEETWWIYSRKSQLQYLLVVFDSSGIYKRHVLD